jgi:hypothetical protein
MIDMATFYFCNKYKCSKHRIPQSSLKQRNKTDSESYLWTKLKIAVAYGSLVYKTAYSNEGHHQ